MEVTASQLFWRLLAEKLNIQAATGPSSFTKSYKAKEEAWERFKTVSGMTGRLASDYSLTPEAAESDLDTIGQAEISPRLHDRVLHDPGVDFLFSPQAKGLKDKIERGKKARQEGGDAKNYGRGFICKQFETLDLSLLTMKKMKVSYSLTELDETFAREMEQLKELSVTGQKLTRIAHLPPSLVSLNAHCNSISSWPKFQAFNFRHIGLGGNMINNLEELGPHAQNMQFLTSLDLSSNRIATISQLQPLQQLTRLSKLRLLGNPIVLLPNYRQRVLAKLPLLSELDDSTVLENERENKNALVEEGREEAEGQEETEGQEALERKEDTASKQHKDADDGDTDDKFSLALTIGRIEGLENPTPSLPDKPEGGGEEGEEAEVSPEQVFYQEHPPSFFVEIPFPSSLPLRTREILWEEGEGDSAMNFEFSQRIELSSSFQVLNWMRFEGLVVDLYMKKQVYVPPPPPKDEGEEGEQEQEGKEDEEGREPPPPQFVTRRIATSTIATEDLVTKSSTLKVKASMTMTDEHFDTIRPIDDKDTERAIANMKRAEKKKENKEKEKKKEKAKEEPKASSGRQGTQEAYGGGRQHHHNVHIECQLDLNPPPAPPQEAEE
uniref:U2A'/phosphoprotein 32 family A C-terminal domain-containing protein n=1 Tax=Guillardia theta TaxID=55529 RepID=A0A7S4KSF4_GUITH|mmetsp:Transcript_30211/g.97181  ORF Transcript_30211/g.97181 Transcript_30211/m.97181 type:complete len:609 (+) Transcript_30211:298-2124(+)